MGVTCYCFLQRVIGVDRCMVQIYIPITIELWVYLYRQQTALGFIVGDCTDIDIHTTITTNSGRVFV